MDQRKQNRDGKKEYEVLKEMDKREKHRDGKGEDEVMK